MGTGYDRLCKHLDFDDREQPSRGDKKGCNMTQRYNMNINGTLQMYTMPIG